MNFESDFPEEMEQYDEYTGDFEAAPPPPRSGSSPAGLIIALVFGLVFIAMATHASLWVHYQKQLPPKEKKKVSKKKMAKERKRGGVQPAGE
mmetsp:Transcript_18740/g.22437  ORF Transcript_18740/g.22437 Transcript_18740/m.22437 type:complete len:92 (-) Transcript_18740:110-385(-)|eukprot:CAMPEP_0197860936 /NCGR_PEP_ID=MMETSP1438-20131217/36648_1 /TAXON_ID=1461541 /ORGANISM="Pterosperma sp., Strain CCMP1384" /LENGTH=91 /DNA_ID=CAMNT_0043477957 /DNA_START=64 /DNA_END=339 /DNA_ORIENTATION=+